MIAMFDLVFEEAFPSSAWEREKCLYFYNHLQFLRNTGKKANLTSYGWFGVIYLGNPLYRFLFLFCWE